MSKLKKVILIIVVLLLLFSGQVNAQLKIDLLAEKYNTRPYYLEYVLETEKYFKLKPYSLLALIAQESGFRPITHIDGGSLSYNTTQMKMSSAITAHMAMTKYYRMDVVYPTDCLLKNNKYYATFLAGGYLRYLNDVYKDEDYYETYTAYNWGIDGRMIFYNMYGHFRSPYAISVKKLQTYFKNYLEEER